MKDSIRQKLEKLAERHEEVSALLADPGVISNNDQFRELSMEYARLEPIVRRYREYLTLLGERTHAQEMADGSDAELRDLGREELASLNARIERPVGVVPGGCNPRVRHDVVPLVRIAPDGRLEEHETRHVLLDSLTQLFF